MQQSDPATGWVAPVLEGKAQYGVGDPGLLKLRNDGKPVVVLAQIFQHSPEILLTLRESGIFSPDELAGKKVMLSQDDIGSAPIHAMLLDTLQDMESVEVIPHSYNYTDLLNGKVDAITGYLSNEPFRLKQQGMAVNIIDPRSYGIDFYGDNLFTTEKEISEHPERVEKMIRATLKGWAYALENKDEIIDLILKKYNPDLDQDQLRYEAKVVDQMIVPDLIPIGDINPRRYERIAETYQRLGMSTSSNVPDGFTYRDLPEPAVSLTPEERAWLEAHPVITLGGGIFPPLDAYNEVKGRPEGIGPDYTELIGDMLGIEFKYISGDWAKILRMAKEKEIDGIRIMLRNKEREAYLNFTQSQTSIQYAIFVQKQSGKLLTLKGLSHKHVGVMGDTYSHSYLREHCPDIEVVPFKSIDDALFALIGGKLDAVVASLTVAGIAADRLFITSLKVAALVPEMDNRLQIGVRKDWPQLVTILNKAINAITTEQHREIKRRWITFNPVDLLEPLSLSPEKRTWLAQDHTVQVRVTNFPPYIILKKDGDVEGISIDYLKLIAERTGVKFKYHFSGKIFSEALDGLNKHQGPDLISTMMRTPEREKSIFFSKDYLKSPYVIFIHTDEKEVITDIADFIGKRIALPKGTVIHEKIKRAYPNIDRVLFDSDAQALEAVATKKVDAYIGNLTLASSIILQKGLANLKIAAPTSFGDHIMSMGIRNDWPELVSIIDRAIDTLSVAEQAAIRSKYFKLQYEYGIRPTDVLKWILVVAGAGSCIVLLFIYWNRSLTKQVQERTETLARSHKSLEAEIVERQQAQQKLQEYQQRLKALATQLTIAEEKERRRIAADLHDHVGQALALARMQLFTARKNTSKEKLDDDVRAILFRNTRELLTNAVKHARGNKVTVRVEFGEIDLKVVVQDDGVGFDPDALSQSSESPGGFGLFSIQERMSDLGGSSKIESEPGKGCKAILTAPLGTDLG